MYHKQFPRAVIPINMSRPILRNGIRQIRRLDKVMCYNLPICQFHHQPPAFQPLRDRQCRFVNSPYQSIYGFLANPQSSPETLKPRYKVGPLLDSLLKSTRKRNILFGIRIECPSPLESPLVFFFLCALSHSRRPLDLREFHTWSFRLNCFVQARVFRNK